MTYNENVLLKVGQRWRYDDLFIAEIVSFTDMHSVKLQVVQCLRNGYKIGTVVHHTMNDPCYTLLEGQERP